MSSDKPVFLYKDILHVRISDSRKCEVAPGPGMCRLTVSHGAFRNDGISGYHSPALAAMEETNEEWIFLDWWTGSWAENTVRFRLQTLIRKHPQINGALFDEAVAGNGTIAFAAGEASFAYDYYGNLPSSMLIRRDVLHTLLGNVDSLFPYPIQKLSDAARKAGMTLEKVHETIAEKSAAQDHLMVPADRQALLRGKNREKKKLLVITHELSWTGAPIVLAEACIDVLKPAGYEIMVVSPTEGPLSEKYLQNGISVMTLPEIALPDSKELYALVQPYDAVIVNTIVPYAAIKLLNTLEKPVLWWIHECELVYEAVGELLPKQLSDHVHVCCVGQHALAVLKKYHPNYNAQSLIYGLQDQNPAKNIRKHTPGKRFRFATIGSIESRKGQDILFEAIALLDDDIRNQCEFIFAGKSLSSEILTSLKAMEEINPDHIHYMGLVPRDVLADVYPDIDCVICPSRDDPMPTYVTEGMMYGKPAICSENTGTASILRAEDAGFVYSNNDPHKLADAITAYVSLSEEERKGYSNRARACFDNNFTLDVFRKNLLQVMEAFLSPAAQMK